MKRKIFIRVIESAVHLFSLVCFLLLMGCSSENSKNKNLEILEIRPDVMEATSFLKYVNKIRIVPLEKKPNVVIGHVGNILNIESRFYVFDFIFTKSVFIFSDKGSWINTINSVGKGPGEYASPSQITYDPYNRHLLIYDPPSKKILRFDLDGNFKSEINVEAGTYSLGVVDRETYAIKTRDNNGKIVVKTIDHKGLNAKTVFKERLEFGKHFFKQFYNFDQSLYYIEYLNDTIYQILRDTSKPYSYIDFLDLKTTQSDKQNLLNDFRTNQKNPTISRAKAGEINICLETEAFLKLNCQYKGKYSGIWIDKTKGNQYLLSRKINDEIDEKDPLTELLFISMATNDSGGFVMYISTDTYLNLLESKEFGEYSDLGVIEVENNGFIDQREVTLESNPLLVLIEMK